MCYAPVRPLAGSEDFVSPDISKITRDMVQISGRFVRPLLALLIALILVSPPVLAHDSEPSLPVESNAEVAHNEIGYNGTDFEPKRLEVKPGDHVMFINRSDDFVWPASNIHPTHEIYPGFDPELGLEPGQSWSFVFDRPGEWRFHNHLQPNQGGLIVVLGVESVAASDLTEAADPELLQFEPLGALTPEQAGPLFEDDDYLVEAIKTHGPAAVVDELSRNADALGVNCHERAHELGHLSYLQFGATAYSLASHECQSGSYHGATEAMFLERGTSDIASDVKKICASTTNSFFHFQCVHGIGHGLMAWTNYELIDALAICDNLKTPEQDGPADARACYSGVFMENVVGGLSGAMGHFTSYLSDDDVHYPCNILDKKYVPACYGYQTTHMIRLLRYDFLDLAVACAEAPRYAHRDCYASMGRDVGSVTQGRPDLAIEYCGYVVVPKRRLLCIHGAVQNSFWEARGAELALEFCRTVSDTEVKDRCYITIMGRARHILAPDEMRRFCAAIEPGYHMRIPVRELLSRAVSSLNPFADNGQSSDEISGYEACRRPAPQLDQLTHRIASWFDS